MSPVARLCPLAGAQHPVMGSSTLVMVTKAAQIEPRRPGILQSPLQAPLDCLPPISP